MGLNRRIAMSLVLIGITGAAATGGTFAVFNDQESSRDNFFTAGSLNLRIDWNESYNGELIERQTFTDNPGPIFDFQDLKPGDRGEATVSLHVFDNPAWIWMRVRKQKDSESGCTEPEKEVEPGCEDDGNGELDEHLQLLIWRDNGNNLFENESLVFNGSLSHLENHELTNGTLLDGDLSDTERDPFVNSTTEFVGLRWILPNHTGNTVQTDSLVLSLNFTAVQRRHIDQPENPFEEVPTEMVPLQLSGGVGPEKCVSKSPSAIGTLDEGQTGGDVLSGEPVFTESEIRDMNLRYVKLGLPNISQHRERRWGDNSCAPTSVAASFIYFNNTNVSGLTPQNITALVDELRNRMKTDSNGTDPRDEMGGKIGYLHAHGFGNNFSIKWINQNASNSSSGNTQVGNVTVKLRNRLPDFNDFRRELSAGEDVTAGFINRTHNRTLGHNMAGYAVNGQNPDGTYDVVFMDPSLGAYIRVKMYPDGKIEYRNMLWEMVTMEAVSLK